MGAPNPQVFCDQHGVLEAASCRHGILAVASVASPKIYSTTPEVSRRCWGDYEPESRRLTVSWTPQVRLPALGMSQQGASSGCSLVPCTELANKVHRKVNPFALRPPKERTYAFWCSCQQYVVDGRGTIYSCMFTHIIHTYNIYILYIHILYIYIYLVPPKDLPVLFF